MIGTPSNEATTLEETVLIIVWLLQIFKQLNSLMTFFLTHSHQSGSSVYTAIFIVSTETLSLRF